MAYPDTNQDRRDEVDPYRDPKAIDTRATFNWPIIIGVAAAVMLLLAVVGSSNNTTATHTPADAPSVQTPSDTDAPAKAPPPASPAP